jgi:hypothetical protein
MIAAGPARLGNRLTDRHAESQPVRGAAVQRMIAVQTGGQRAQEHAVQRRARPADDVLEVRQRFGDDLEPLIE